MLPPISWNQFKPLLNQSGNDLSNQLKNLLLQYCSLIEFRVNKGGFLDLFIKMHDQDDQDDQDDQEDQENLNQSIVMNEIKKIYPDLYKRVTLHECE